MAPITEWELIVGDQRSGLRSDRRLRLIDSRLSFFLVLVAAADNVGDVGVLFFLLLDERVVVIVIEALVEFYIVVAGIGIAGRRLLGAGGLGIGLFERDGLNL